MPLNKKNKKPNQTIIITTAAIFLFIIFLISCNIP